MDIAEIRRKAKQLQEKVEESPVTVAEIEEALEKPELAESVEEALKTEMHSLEASLVKEEEYKVGEEKIESGDHETPEEDREESPAETAEEEIEAITFFLDKEEYAIDIHQVKEVIKTRELTEIPGAPRDIIGIISLRGVVIPIMNLRSRLGMPVKDGGERIIIVKDGTNFLGLIVDDVRHVVRVPQKEIEPPPAINTIDGEFIRGIGRYKGVMFILLEIEKILERE